MTSESIPARLTFADFMALPEGPGLELIDGVLTVTPSPGRYHQALVRRLTIALGHFVEQHQLGFLYPAPFDVYLRKEDPALVVQPDLTFISHARASCLEDRGMAGAPDLVVEIVSPANPGRDTVRKRRYYEQFGVEEYWLVLPDLEQVQVLRREGDDYGRPQVFQPGDEVTTAVLPGFGLSVTKLFEPKGA